MEQNNHARTTKTSLRPKTDQKWQFHQGVLTKVDFFKFFKNFEILEFFWNFWKFRNFEIFEILIFKIFGNFWNFFPRSIFEKTAGGSQNCFVDKTTYFMRGRQKFLSGSPDHDFRSFFEKPVFAHSFCVNAGKSRDDWALIFSSKWKVVIVFVSKMNIWLVARLGPLKTYKSSEVWVFLGWHRITLANTPLGFYPLVWS